VNTFNTWERGELRRFHSSHILICNCSSSLFGRRLPRTRRSRLRLSSKHLSWLLLGHKYLLDEVGVEVVDVDMLFLQKLKKLLKLVIWDLRKLLSLLILFLLDYLLLDWERMLSGLFGFTATLWTLGNLLFLKRLLLLLLQLLLVLLLHNHLLILLLLHLLLLMHLINLVLLQINDPITSLLILNLHLILLLPLLILQILGTFLILLVQLLLNLLPAADNHLILENHLLRLDVLDALSLECNSLLLLDHKVLDELLGERELPRVLVVLLLQVLQEHLPVLIIQLIQVDHHLLVLFLLLFPLIFLLLIYFDLSLLILVARLLVLELLELLGNVDVKLFLLLLFILILLLMLSSLEQLGLMLLQEVTCVLVVFKTLQHSC